jgi:hypothetical protein
MALCNRIEVRELDQIFQLIESAADSQHAALLITLCVAVALGWGWWRRELAHSTRYDALETDRAAREKVFLDCINQRDSELAALAKEAFGVLQDTSSALAGMERTLDAVEALVHASLNNRLYPDDKKGEDDGKQPESK